MGKQKIVRRDHRMKKNLKRSEKDPQKRKRVVMVKKKVKVKKKTADEPEEEYVPSIFKRWLEWYGPQILAEDLGLRYNTSVYRWMAKGYFPRVETMTRIIELSEHKLTYDQIIKGCYHETYWWHKSRNLKVPDKKA